MNGHLDAVAAALPAFLPTQRWFGGKGRPIAGARLVARAPLEPAAGGVPGTGRTLLTIAEVRYDDGGVESYFLPLLALAGDGPAPRVPIARADGTTIYDAFGDPGFCRALLGAIERAARLPASGGGAIACERGPASAVGPRSALVDGPVRPVGSEQSNTSVVFGDALILKAFRRLRAGVNPEVEILRFLGEQGRFDRVPALHGTVEYRGPEREPTSLAILQAFVPNEGDGWSWTLRALATLVATAPSRPGAGVRRGEDPAPSEASEAAYLAGVAELGRVTAGLHLALAAAPDVPAFAPQPITRDDVRAWQEGVARRLDAALGRLREQLDRQPAATRRLGRAVLAAGARLHRAAVGLDGLAEGGIAKIRHHGDYHLGQVLKTADSFAILDFEGEPLRPLAERRARHTPLKDVAGMLRSFNYARHAAERELGVGSRELGVVSSNSRLPTPNSRSAVWEGRARRAFLDAYLEQARAGGAPFLPRSDDALRRVLAALELEKAAYELEYELGNRPDWLDIPLGALAAIREP